MNRTTSLFLAIGILLAHALAVHQTETGGFAGALDEAHVAFRIGRQLFRDGVASWNTGSPGFDAYPSLLWILVAWIPERLYRDPIRFCQIVGLLSALATAIVVSRFSRDRLAGIIAPFLLVFSGAFVTAATSGTEATALALLITLSFLCSERRRPRLLALSLVLTVLASPQGGLIVIALVIVGWLRDRLSSEPATPSMRFVAAPAVVMTILIASMRHSMTGQWFSPTVIDLATYDSARVSLGISYLSDFLLKSGSAFLIVFPLIALALGKLSGTAIRGLALVLFWIAMVVWTGGNGLPFWVAIAPILPIMFVTIQEGMTAGIDNRHVFVPTTTWATFVLALIMCCMVSKKPGNIGSIALAETHFSALKASPAISSAYQPIHGRESARVALRKSARLRDIGAFLRKELRHDQTVLTPWPGALGYHSRRLVLDLLGRTTLLPGHDRLNSWSGDTKVDLVAQIKEHPDNLLLNIKPLDQLPPPNEMIAAWLTAWDVEGNSVERRAELVAELSNYRLVTIPIKYQDGDPILGQLAPFFLLRSQDTAIDPALEIEASRNGEFRVLARHQGHDLLADLQVYVVDRAGKNWYVKPTGGFSESAQTLTRPGLLLFRTTSRSLQLINFKVPTAIDAVRVVAMLRNPGAPREFVFSNVGEPVEIEIVD